MLMSTILLSLTITLRHHMTQIGGIMSSIFVVFMAWAVFPNLVRFFFDNIGEEQVSLPTLMLPDGLVEERELNYTSILTLHGYGGKCT